MDFEAKKRQISQNMLVRVGTFLSAIEELKGDLGYLRSFYILLSFAFELLLKARFVIISKAEDIDQLNIELLGFQHDIKKISEALGSSQLTLLGITSIKLNNRGFFKGWIVCANGKTMSVEDFVNVRYDFLSDELRDNANEDLNKQNEDLGVFYAILAKAKL